LNNSQNTLEDTQCSKKIRKIEQDHKVTQFTQTNTNISQWYENNTVINHPNPTQLSTIIDSKIHIERALNNSIA
jgi:hypothetical protein